MLRQLFTLLALMTGLAVSGDLVSVQPAQAAEVACAAQAETMAEQVSPVEQLAQKPRLPVDPGVKNMCIATAVAVFAPTARIRVDRALE